MAALRLMVEDAYHNGQPRHGPPLRVRLMCHSMGCNVAHSFLSRFERGPQIGSASAIADGMSTARVWACRYSK